jgi:two-component system phosphate regulon response regulator OmpR
VQVTRLRRKIEADPRAPIFLQTVRGIGYRLAAD